MLYRDGKPRLTPETPRAVMGGLDKARGGLWYIGVLEEGQGTQGNGQPPLQGKYRASMHGASVGQV